MFVLALLPQLLVAVKI